MKKLTKQLKKAFTLIELVVVIAVIAILSGVSVVSYVGITKNAKQRACETEALQLKTLLMSEDISNNNFSIEGNKIKFNENYSWLQLKESLAMEDSEFANLLKNTSVSEDGLKLIYSLDKSSTVLFEFDEKEEDTPLTEEDLAILEAKNAWNEMKQSYASFISENGDKNHWFYDYINDEAIYEGNSKYLVTTNNGVDFSAKTNDGSTKKEWDAITKNNASVELKLPTLDGTPFGLKLSYYDDIYSRGFVWATSEEIEESSLYIKKGNNTEDSFFSNSTLISGTTIKSDTSNIHKVHITNLDKNTTYSYKVGSESGWKYGIFRTETPNPTSYTGIQLSDSQSKDKELYYKWENTFAQAVETAGRSIDSILFGGDQFNSGTFVNDENLSSLIYIEAINKYLGSTPYMAIGGNHDYGENYFNVNCVNFANEQQDGSYFSYNFGKIHFINLETGKYSKNENDFKIKEGSKQVQWLESDLIKANQDGCIWIIVSMHNGLFSTGDHSNDLMTQKIVEQLAPLFSRYHVDLVLQAHDHTFCKTLPYRWDSAGYTETKNDSLVVNLNPEKSVIDGISYDKNPNGTYYVTTGAAGHRFGESEKDAGIWAELNGNQPLLDKVGFTYNKYKTEVGKITQSNSYSSFSVKDTTISQADLLGLNKEDKFDYTSPQIYTANVSNASANVNANMFGILNIKDNTLRYDFYTVEGNNVKLFDSLSIIKTSN